MMLVMCPEKVDSDCSMDCSSPMSAKMLWKMLKRRAGLGRDVQPGLGHQRQQPDRLEGDRLAAGVGPGDDQREGLLVQLDVDRHHRLPGRAAGGGPGTGEWCCRGASRGLCLMEWHQHRFGGMQVLGVFGAHQGQVERASAATICLISLGMRPTWSESSARMRRSSSRSASCSSR